MSQGSSESSSSPVTPHSSSVSVILFDVGGVLIELGGVAPMLQWLGYRMASEELWRNWLHSSSVRDFETGRIQADEFALRLIDELDLRVDPQQFLHSFAGWPTGPFPGVLDLVERIPARYVRAVLSNSNALHWPRVHDTLGSLFSHYFVSHLTGRIKPDAAAFEHVTATLQCRPDNVLFLDDNLLNVEAARRLGMQAFVVRGTNDVHRALQNAGVLDTAG